MFHTEGPQPTSTSGICFTADVAAVLVILLWFYFSVTEYITNHTSGMHVKLKKELLSKL